MPNMPTKVHLGREKLKKPKRKNWLKDQSHKKIYNSQRWRNFREFYIQRYPVCEEEGCTQAGRFVDHIKPISEGGDVFEEENVQTLCPSCNGRKTQAQGRKLK